MSAAAIGVEQLAGQRFDGRRTPAGRKVSAQQRAIAKYDTDGDGQLSIHERKAARLALIGKSGAQYEAAQLAAQQGGSGLGASMSGGGGCNRGGSSSMAGMGQGMNALGMNGMGMGMGPGNGGGPRMAMGGRLSHRS